MVGLSNGSSSAKSDKRTLREVGKTRDDKAKSATLRGNSSSSKIAAVMRAAAAS